jgi:glycosyltransferase involved in cell wall biosynthesis
MIVGITCDQTCLVLRGRLRKLREVGFSVLLISSPGGLLTRIAGEEGVPTCPLAMRRGISPLRDVVSLVKLCLVLRRERPVITDFSTPKAGLLGNLAAWFLRVPHRVYTLRGLKLESAQGWKRRLLLEAERVSARCAHVVLCNSESLRREALRLGIAPESKLRILGRGSSNGVDTARFRPPSPGERARQRQLLQFGEEDTVIGFVGRLTRDKGVPELLAAFLRISQMEPGCRLLLVGWYDEAEDALHPGWRDLVASHRSICHTGFVEDVAPYYWAMDLLVLPTRREGFPNVVLEAAASGLAVVTTETTGSLDAVAPEVTGLLVPAGNVEAIVEMAGRLVRNSERRRRMGVAARDWVCSHFSQERILSIAAEFYLGLMGAAQPVAV